MLFDEEAPEIARTFTKSIYHSKQGRDRGYCPRRERAGKVRILGEEEVRSYQTNREETKEGEKCA
jgi:hypothetical protein